MSALLDSFNMTESLKSALEESPEFLRANDLIRLGLYKSPSDITHAVKRGLAPPMIKVGERKTIFPKGLLISWLAEKTKRNITNDNAETLSKGMH